MGPLPGGLGQAEGGGATVCQALREVFQFYRCGPVQEQNASGRSDLFARWCLSWLHKNRQNAKVSKLLVLGQLGTSSKWAYEKGAVAAERLIFSLIVQNQDPGQILPNCPEGASRTIRDSWAQITPNCP